MHASISLHPDAPHKTRNAFELAYLCYNVHITASWVKFPCTLASILEFFNMCDQVLYLITESTFVFTIFTVLDPINSCKNPFEILKSTETSSQARVDDHHNWNKKIYSASLHTPIQKWDLLLKFKVPNYHFKAIHQCQSTPEKHNAKSITQGFSH